MKRTDKLICGVATGILALGLVFRMTGAFGGGRAESRQYEREVLDNGYWGPIHAEDDGFWIGGRQGLWIGSEGIRFGERLEGLADIGVKEQIRESGELAGITGVDVDIDFGDIQVLTGESCNAVLSWNFSGYALDYRVENGVLKVESESQREGVSGNLEMTSLVVITLPAETELHEMDLSTDFGNISVEAEGVTGWEVEMTTNLGDVNCFGLTARELKAESDLGDVTVHFPQRENVGYHLSAQLGTVKVNDTTFQGEGEMKLEAQEQMYFVEASTDLGDVTLLY